MLNKIYSIGLKTLVKESIEDSKELQNLLAYTLIYQINKHINNKAYEDLNVSVNYVELKNSGIDPTSLPDLGNKVDELRDVAAFVSTIVSDSLDRYYILQLKSGVKDIVNFNITNINSNTVIISTEIFSRKKGD